MNENDTDPQGGARQQMAEARFQKDISDIVDIGRTEFGSDTFDQHSHVIAEKFGDRRREFMAVASQFDAPHRIIVHLSDNPRRLETIAKLPTHRMIAEIAKIESEMSPHGHSETFAEPSWRRPESRTGRVSDSDWKRNYGANLSDAQFDKEFNRRMTERAKERGYLK
jgi:hypothetical protein